MIRWYEEGLRFECQSCGNCCRNHGEYSYVYLSARDVAAISEQLSIPQEDLLHQYCEQEDGWIFLINSSDNCPFLKKGGCKVYSVRPKQCATWPFWTENLRVQVWNGPVTKCCPGVGKGKLYSADEIDEIACQRDEWYRD